ncbi:hypothetical protein H5410_015908 [Solanum commersonii]|uniref:Uncharacterized protein n=1 Tax=Solanum commersonii TaxID=4109 RepID=A0A9J5ZVT4_SOLCO|nr:hypothetical protein H5410_015908 [Solanum commersonii]
MKQWSLLERPRKSYYRDLSLNRMTDLPFDLVENYQNSLGRPNSSCFYIVEKCEPKDDQGSATCELHYNKDSIDQDVTYKSKSNFKVVEGKGDLKETDEVFLFRSRGGREDQFALFESIMRKRIIPPISANLVLNQAPEYFSWLLSVKSNYQLKIISLHDIFKLEIESQKSSLPFSELPEFFQKGIFEGLASLVDIGGGSSTMSIVIVEAFPR